jgi:hypothetical protein
VLTLLLWGISIPLWFVKGAVEPEARLWAIFMIVQSLPFAAAVLVSIVNALEQMRHARSLVETPVPAEPVASPAMQPAQ